MGICVTQLDAALVERGIACTPASLPTFTAAVAAVDKIRFFVGQMPSRLKVHVTIGHQTVMGDIQFFGLPDAAGVPQRDALHAVMARMDLLTSQVHTQAQTQLLWYLIGITMIACVTIIMMMCFYHSQQELSL